MALASLHVIYDGQCGFCLRALRVVRRLDHVGRVRYHDAHDRRTIEAAFPQLPMQDLDEAMYVVSADGHVHRGFYGFRRLIWISPLTWLLAPVFYAPGLAFVGERVYAWVARNRHRLGCTSEVCDPSVAAGAGGPKPSGREPS